VSHPSVRLSAWRDGVTDVRLWLGRTLALVVALATGAVWFVAASRFVYRVGPHEAAVALGLLTGIAVALTMWRWTVTR